MQKEFVDLVKGSANENRHSVRFWTSLCFEGGRIQWLAGNSCTSGFLIRSLRFSKLMLDLTLVDEERDLAAIDRLLSDLNSDADVDVEENFCYFFTGEFGEQKLKAEQNGRLHPTLCTSTQQSISQSAGSIRTLILQGFYRDFTGICDDALLSCFSSAAEWADIIGDGGQRKRQSPVTAIKVSSGKERS